jgi:hypothetical protein
MGLGWCNSRMKSITHGSCPEWEIYLVKAQTEMIDPMVESDRSRKAKTPYTESRETNYVSNSSNFLYKSLNRLTQSHIVHIFSQTMEQIIHRTNIIISLTQAVKTLRVRRG